MRTDDAAIPRSEVCLDDDISLGQWLQAAFFDAVRFPFRKDGWMIVLPGAAFWPLILFASLFPFLTSGVLIVLIGYLAAYFFEVIAMTISGKDAPPDWPELDNFLDGILIPAFQVLTLFAISLSPRFFVVDDWSDFVETLDRHWGLWMIAAIYFPIGCIGTVLFGTIFGALPHRILPAILKSPAATIPCVVFAIIVGCMAKGAALFAETMPTYLTVPAGALVAFYVLLFYGRIIGLTARRFRARLGLG